MERFSASAAGGANGRRLVCRTIMCLRCHAPPPAVSASGTAARPGRRHGPGPCPVPAGHERAAALGLFHDFPEARIGDLPSLGRPYATLEYRSPAADKLELLLQARDYRAQGNQLVQPCVDPRSRRSVPRRNVLRQDGPASRTQCLVGYEFAAFDTSHTDPAPCVALLDGFQRTAAVQADRLRGDQCATAPGRRCQPVLRL
jgi:hypothetical protein